MLGITAPTAKAALDISATTIANPARQNNYLPIEWSVTNTDGFARDGVTLTMVFPAGLAALGDGSFGGDCPRTACEPGETITWLLGTIPAGGARTFRFTPRISTATSDGTTISFEPTITDDQLDSASTTLAVGVDSGSLYDLALSGSRDPVTAGSLLTYKVTFGYLQDTAAVTNTTVRFNVPANTTFV